MKTKSFTLLIFLFFSIGVFGQTIHKSFFIGISCGASGQTSEELVLIKNALHNTNDSLLLSFISSDNFKLQYLSIFAIIHLKGLRNVALSAEQKQLIKNLKKRKDTLTLCWLCTGHFYASIRRTLSVWPSWSRHFIYLHLLQEG